MSDVPVPMKRAGLPIPTLFEALGVEPVTKDDAFSIEYDQGLLTATINRVAGPVEVVRRSVGHDGFHETTVFDPRAMTQQQRNDVISRLSHARMTQSEISRRTGVPQPTVSNVLRKRARTTNE
jgi:uncharacterized protein YerC